LASVLGWVQIDLPVQILAVLGLAFLLFLAGLEIDLHTLRGHALRLAVLGYGLTLVLGVAIGVGLGAVGWTRSPLLIGIALSATSLGLVVPVPKDAGQADRVIGVIFPATALSRLREGTHPSASSTPASPSDASAHSEAM
jgi:Kef-type K+ transport system membrane component KefB